MAETHRTIQHNKPTLAHMGKQEKIIDTILRGNSDANISFADVRSLLLHLGFEERIRGSHHVYRKPGIEEKINIQDLRKTAFKPRSVEFH